MPHGLPELPACCIFVACLSSVRSDPRPPPHHRVAQGQGGGNELQYGGLITKGHITIFYGAGGCLKTTCVYNFAACVLNGAVWVPDPDNGEVQVPWEFKRDEWFLCFDCEGSLLSTIEVS